MGCAVLSAGGRRGLRAVRVVVLLAGDDGDGDGGGEDSHGHQGSRDHDGLPAPPPQLQLRRGRLSGRPLGGSGWWYRRRRWAHWGCGMRGGSRLHHGYRWWRWCRTDRCWSLCLVLGVFDGVAQDGGPGFGQRTLAGRFSQGVGDDLTQLGRCGGRKVLGVGGALVAGQQPQCQQAQFVGVGVDGGQFLARRCAPARCFHLR